MKVLKKIGTILAFIIVLIIVFVFVLAAMLFNNTDETPEYVEDVDSLDSEITGLVELAMDDTATDNLIGLDLTVEDINVILAAAINQLKAQNITYIKSAYIKEVDGVFVLYVPLTVKGISTLFSSSINLSQNDEQIILALDNISISKLRVTSFVSRTVLPQLLSEEQVEDSFSQIGIKADVNFSEMSISLDKADILSLLNSQMGESYEPLMDALYSVIKRNNLLNVGTNNNTLGISVDVTEAKSNSEIMGTNSNRLDLTEANNLVKYMLNHSSFATGDCDLLMKYLIFGYSNLTTSEQTQVDSWDLSIINITDKENYTPIKTLKDADISDSLLSQIALADIVSVLLQSSYGLKIEETTINNVLYNQEVVGMTHTFIRYNHVTQEYDVASIGVTGLWMEILNNQAYFNITIDINGCELGLKLDLNNPSSTLLTLNNKVSSAQLGTMDLNDEEISNILTFLSQEVAGMSWMSIDSENRTINFNFAQLMPQSSILQKIATFYTNRKITYVGSNLDDEGYIQITYHN